MQVIQSDTKPSEVSGYGGSGMKDEQRKAGTNNLKGGFISEEREA